MTQLTDGTKVTIKKLSATEKKKHQKDFEKIKKDLAAQGIDPKSVQLRKITNVKRKIPRHTIKLNENLKVALDFILADTEKSTLKERGCSQIVEVYDEYNKSAPYVSVIYKMKLDKENEEDEGENVERISIKKGDDYFDVDPIRRFLLKQLLNHAEEINISK